MLETTMRPLNRTVEMDAFAPPIFYWRSNHVFMPGNNVFEVDELVVESLGEETDDDADARPFPAAPHFFFPFFF